jgi:hypothetical protein
MKRLFLMIVIVAAAALANLGCSDVTAPDRSKLEGAPRFGPDETEVLGGAPVVFYSSEATASMINFRAETTAILQSHAAGENGNAGENQNGSFKKTSATLKVPSQFPTIQEAVQAAVPGNRIRIDGGTYNEVVIVTTPSIRIEGLHNATVNGGFWIHATDVKIKGLTITQTNPNHPTIYANESDELTITHCTISGGACGIWMEETSGGWFAFSTIEGGIDGIRAENNCQENLFMLNDLKGETRDGILLSNGCHKNVVKLNDLSQSGRLGLLINVSNDNHVLFNSINENGDTGMAVQSFGSPEQTVNNQIIGNEANWNTRWGIVMTVGAQGNVIRLNKGYSNGICDIVDFVGGNTISANKVSCVQTF